MLKWKDGISAWNQFKDVKESYLVRLVDYTIENGLDKQHAFAWWIHNLWWNEIIREKNVRPAFEVGEDDVKNLVGCNKNKTSLHI